MGWRAGKQTGLGAVDVYIYSDQNVVGELRGFTTNFRRGCLLSARRLARKSLPYKAKLVRFHQLLESIVSRGGL